MRSEDVKYILPEMVYLATGASIKLGALPGQIAIELKYVGGASMFISSPSFSSLYPTKYLGGVTQIGFTTSYLVDIGEIMNSDLTGPNCWVTAQGGTLQFAILRHIGPLDI